MGSVAARRVGVGEVLDDDRAGPEQIGPNLHVLDDLLAKGQVWMRPIDAAVDDGHADTSPRDSELGPDPIGPDERNTLVEEIVELTVVVDRRSEEHTSELQSRGHLVCRLLLEKKKNIAS